MKMRIFLWPVAALLALAMLFAFAPGSRGDEEDKGILASLISRALSTPATQVSIGAVEGALSSDATIRDITISDRDGVWFRLDRARLVWRRLALLSRRLEIDRLEIGQLTVLRRPLPAEEAVPGADEPLLPELPVKVQIADFLLQKLVLGEPILGTAAQVSASGSASLGNPAEGLNLRFNANRIDALGSLTARLGYASERLELTVALDEPEGGILARAASIPGLPPVRLDLSGNGTLDAFAAQLAFNAGPDIGATGRANLQRAANLRRLTLNLDARVEGLLPALVAPVFAGTTALAAETTFADDGTVAIPGLTLTSRTARLDARGTLSAARDLDLTVQARAVPTDQGRTVAGGAEIRRLAFDGSVSGPLAAPRIAGTLQAEDARLPQGRLSKLDATFSAVPNGALSEPTTRIALVADAQASGVALSDPALAKAVGDRLTLTLRGQATPEGAATIETASLATPTVEASFSGDLGRPDAVGKLNVRAGDLARFGDVASLRLRGALELAATLQGALSSGPVSATLDGRITRFATGIAALDNLAGGRLALTGTARLLPRGGFGFDNLQLAGAYATARLDGEATQASAAIDALVNLPDLKRADSRLSGRGAITGRLTGTLQNLDATLQATIEDATALGRPIPRLAINADARNITGPVELRATLDGSVNRKPATGTVQARQLPDGGWRLDTIDLTVGSASIQGQLSLDPESRATGRLTVAAENLDDLSPLVLQRLSGDIAATLDLDASQGSQNVRLEAKGSKIRVADVAIERFEAVASIVDLDTRPAINAAIGIDRATVAGETFTQIRLDAAGSASASDITLAARARGFDLDARGRLIPETPLRFNLASFTAKRGARQIALAQPTTLTFGNGGLAIDALTLAVERGTLRASGRIGDTLDLQVSAQSVPLSAADIVVPNSGFAGTLDGSAEIGGTAAEPTGSWRIRVARLVTPQTRDVLPPLDIAAQGRLADGATTVEGTIIAGSAGSLRVTGRVPLSDTGSLDLTAQGRIDLGIANRTLSVSGRQVTGSGAVDLRIGGTVGNPAVNGSLILSGGSFRDVAQGIRFDNIQGRVTASGSTVTIERLTASTRNGGTLSAAGRVDIDPGAGFPGDLRITGQRAELASNDLVTTTADLALTLSGPLARDPRIGGNVRILSMDVTIPERLPATIRPIPGTRHVNPPPTAVKRLAIAARARENARRGPPFDAMLDLTISAPNRIFVRGRGIDAELGGDLRLTGSLRDPVAIGAFDLRRGRLTVVGNRLDFTRGRITFAGDLTPELDFLAETRAGDVTARVGVTGTAREPQFAFTSDPDLPQDEVLSRLLFAKASGGLSATQALQLAQVAAQFSGGGGNDVFESLRRSLGVEGLDISLGAEGGPTVGISRAISDRVSIGVKAGASTEQSGVSVDIDVTRRIRVQGEVGASGSTAVGVGAEWEY